MLLRNLTSLDGLVRLLLTLPAVFWAISFHEFCHGYVAYLVGDPTAYRQGRLSLNPLAHFDLVGTLMLLFCGFGWAKPVPINTRHFKHPQRDIILVSLAGVAGNFLTASVCALILRFFFTDLAMIAPYAIRFLLIMIGLNLGLASFNLLPIPPLDGSKILYSFIPFRFVRYYYWLEQYGMYILLFLVISGTLHTLTSPLFNFFESLMPFGNYMFLLRFM